MILQEATIGGNQYLEYLDSEMALPESERVTFAYRALTNREKVKLIHEAHGPNPDGAAVCLVAVTSISNLSGVKDGKTVELDTVAKALAFLDKDMAIAYAVEIAGIMIWKKQNGEGEELKNCQ